MFTYAPGIDRYVSDRLSGQRKELLKKVDQFLFLLPRMCGEDEKRHLSTTLLNKTRLLYEGIWSENETLQASISSLRYIFEALIHTELLCEEDDYFEKIYHSVHAHKVEKTKAYLKKLKSDLVLLKDYEKKEQRIKDAYEGVKEDWQFAEYKKKADKLYEELDQEYSVSLDAAEFNSIGVQASYLEDTVIPKMDGHIEELDAEFKLLCKRLTGNIAFNRKFGIRGQSTKVPKVLADKRSWSQRAKDMGLAEEYSFLYQYSSSILHCTSYSILTNKEIEEPEFLMFRSLSNKYMHRIVDRLHVFCAIPRNMVIHEMS